MIYRYALTRSSILYTLYFIQVRIDQIKELQLDDIQSVYSEGEYWLLSKRNELEAVVERYT